MFSLWNGDKDYFACLSRLPFGNRWVLVGICIKRELFLQWLQHLFLGNSQQQSLITVIIWALWLSRNKLMHEGKRQPVSDFFTFVLGYIRELELLGNSYPRTL
ncbi:hypothetical protein ES332_D04G135700v1 [Gossypium tomentosum]|uniref:Uncharacterized protein n=1 Tax=Gossypium tomentosum TaxID=34277 RepID=A0A5D2LCY7_GOSTO|nr:hypothetical protein ES332_D04G135700v1 [Gossypium tomentosum]